MPWTNSGIIRADGGVLSTLIRSYSTSLQLNAGAATAAGVAIDESAGIVTVTGGLDANLKGTNFVTTTASLSNTNLNFVLGSMYQTLTLTTNCNITNILGIGVGSLKILPGGGDRTISFPTNWAWLNTNGMALSGPLLAITLSNRASTVGWLSVVKSAADATNVTAAYQQTPP